ncbi:hypothetical protein J4423_01095 [Candidatus Pacearchaeota archaeon]|nr:hypothetical protein [Candidatus Pacearchaeota archaeon]
MTNKNYASDIALYIVRQEDGDFAVAPFDNIYKQQRGIRVFSKEEDLKLRTYLSRLSKIRHAHIEIYDGVLPEHRCLFGDKKITRIPAGEFLPIVKGLEKKCTDGRVEVVLI